MTGSPLQEELDTEVLGLRRAVEELTILNELSRAISSTCDLDEIIPMIVTRAKAATGAQQVVLTLVDALEMIPAGTIFRKVDSEESDDFHLTRNLLGCMCHERRALLINDVANDSRLEGIPLDAGLRNLLCVPLMVESELVGVISACNKNDNLDFLPHDQQLLAIMASQSAQVLERARLLKEEAANAQLKEDLLVARRIQLSLLPGESPNIPGYDVAGTSIPARHVGGDYYDFIPLNNDAWGIALGDVSGKGVPAAMLMSNLQAMLRGQAPQGTLCRLVMHWCNKQLFLSTPLDKFATLFYGVLNTNDHLFTYCNAGHERPFLFCNEKKPLRLKTGGLAIGVVSDADYVDDTVPMLQGDTLVIFSDGVTDVVNTDDQPFGEDRLLELLDEAQNLPSAKLIEVVKEALAKHAGTQPAFDDITLVIVKRIGSFLTTC
jgi:phosphoserine phosphatase RsbU/P